MTFSQAKIDAHAAMDAAVEQLRDAYREDEENRNVDGVINGWLLITSEMTLYTNADDDPPDDPDAMKNVIGSYSKRGQAAILSYGLSHEYIRHHDGANSA